MTERTRAQVGALVAQRRKDLGLTQSRVAHLAELNIRTLIALEEGAQWPRPDTQAKIETALQWSSGSLEAAREGGTPESIAPASLPQLRERSDTELWDLINSGTLDPGTRAAVVTEYEERQVAELPQRLDRLSRHGLTAVSRYVAILLESASSEGFRRVLDEDS
jgi:transcriptional regulator with XRE-family HTH domain